MQRSFKPHCQAQKIFMKGLIFIYMTLLTLSCGCQKDLGAVENNVDGKWIFTQCYISPGGPGEWRSASPPGQTIEFKPGGQFVPSESFLTGSNHFEILDSVTIKFQPASTSSGYILMGYAIDTLARELLMYPVNPRCIKGCQYRFKRY